MSVRLSVRRSIIRRPHAAATGLLLSAVLACQSTVATARRSAAAAAPQHGAQLQMRAVPRCQRTLVADRRLVISCNGVAAMLRRRCRLLAVLHQQYGEPDVLRAVQRQLSPHLLAHPAVPLARRPAPQRLLVMTSSRTCCSSVATRRRVVIIRPHRMHSTRTRTTVTDVAWSACLCVWIGLFCRP